MKMHVLMHCLSGDIRSQRDSPSAVHFEIGRYMGRFYDAISIQLVTFAAQWMLCISQFFYMHLAPDI